MGGFFGTISRKDCKYDVFFGTDYHSHLGTKRGGMLCIGHRPTLEKDGEISVEVHIFDFDGNLYEKPIYVDFIDKIREEKQFPSLEALQHQLSLDAISARNLICHFV